VKGFLRKLLPRKKPGNDFVGYEILLDFIRRRSLHRLEGDLIEIGAFMGGGTAKLARFARKHGRKVFAVDIFDPDADTTETEDGVKMCDIYRAFLEGRSQREVYQETIRGLGNIVTVAQDSKAVSFPPEQRFFFGFIDGNHRPDYVRNDFDTIWSNLVPGGALGLHDYDYGLSGVTRCIDDLMAEHTDEIGDVLLIRPQHIILLVKRHAGSRG